MAVKIDMRGSLTPYYMTGDFAATINSMQLAAASGKEFLVFESIDGSHIAVASHNILAIKEVDDDDALAASV